MSALVVVDASALVAMVLDSGPVGARTTELVAASDLAAPHLASFEATNILRRQAAAGRVSEDAAALARGDLDDLDIDLWPFDAISARAWELRHNLTIYDASYVAVAELLGAPLVTLDARIARAPGPACEVLVA